MQVIITYPQNTTPPPPPKRYVGYRMLHKAEGGYQKTPPGMPEVVPPDNPVALDMTLGIQRLSYYLMLAANPLITPDLWTHVHNGEIAFTNGQGFGTTPKSGGPRCNFIKGEDLEYELPKYDKAQRLCGGTFFRAEERNGYLYCKAGVHGINPDDKFPSVETVLENNWYLYAVSIGANNPAVISHFPQGKGGPVLIPFIFRGEIRFPASLAEPWDSDQLPDPLKIYHPV